MTRDDLDLLPDAVVVVDGSGHVTRLNDRAARLLGRRRAEVVGMPAADVLRLRDDADTDWWACMRLLEGDPRVPSRLVERDLVLLTPSRSQPVTVTARRTADGDRVAAVAVTMRSGHQRQRLDSVRSELVSTVSHELRAPLTSVRGFIRTLLARWDRFDDEQRQAMLRTVDVDADRVVRLLTDLLDVSRIDAGRLGLSRRMVDLADVAGVVAERFDDDARRRVLVEVGDSVPKVYADADKVQQVLTNLVENAVHYGRGDVRIGIQETAQTVEVVVTDGGGGLKPDELGHLFTKFARRAGERRAGTGLGLYISRGIVQAHGGRMWAESDPGEATRFVFALPRGGLELAGIEPVDGGDR